jgi:hypothetical protein
LAPWIGAESERERMTKYSSGIKWAEWVAPLVIMLLVFSVFQDLFGDLLGGLTEWIGGNSFKVIAFTILMGLAILVGVALSVTLVASEEVSMKTITKRGLVFVVMLAMAFTVNSYAMIFPM